MEQYNKKNTKKTYNTITKPCKKLIQKCSYKSISDTSSLCSLAYWLYIYGDKEPALEICEVAHEVEFSFESQEGTFPDACIATNFSLNENGDIM